jgi:hypothetical protein
MDTDFQTSFIPKRPLAEERVTRPKSVSVFLFVGVIFFIASVASAGFVYIYKTSIEKNVEQMKKDLQTAGEVFEGDFLTELERTDKRINSAGEVLSNHLILSPIFEALSQVTLRSIQFTKFGYTIVSTPAPGRIDVQMSGKSQGYTPIALQSDALAGNKYIKNPIFSNLTLDEQGNVIFNLNFSVDPKFVLFGEVLNRQNSTGEDTSGDLNIQVRTQGDQTTVTGNIGGQEINTQPASGSGATNPFGVDSSFLEQVLGD